MNRNQYFVFWNNSQIPKTKFELKIAKIRGVESRGMLCSESELNLSNESGGIVELKNKDKEIGKSYFKSNSEWLRLCFAFIVEVPFAFKAAKITLVLHWAEPLFSI